MSNWTRPLLQVTTLTASLLASGIALADARIDPLLAKRLSKLKPQQSLEVVVTFKQSGPVKLEQINAIKALGITKGVYMRSLPIMGVVATPAHIKALAKRKDVVSVFYNAPMRYLNRDARQLSGAERVSEFPSLLRRAIPYSGKGVTVVVNDSGIDTTNPDLPLGTKVVDNVQLAQNFPGRVASILAEGIVPYTTIGNQPNTDLGSGHGTHVAGTVGASGVSSNGLYRGVADGADIVGHGSGGVLLILDGIGGLDFAATNQFKYRNPIRVVTNSWGSSGPFDPASPQNIATYELYKRGIVTLFASGNDGPGEDTHNPHAQSPWVIAVGASEKEGVLTSFSSRGRRGESGEFEMPDGTKWTYVNEPTVVADGVAIISTRAYTGALPVLGAEADSAALAPAHLPFYTLSDGTSMSTPHVAGIVALMLEANPNLDPLQVKNILKATATNMGGRVSWEAGAGHVNAFAAVAMAAGLRKDYGRTLTATKSFSAKQILKEGLEKVGEDLSISYDPVASNEATFELQDGVATVFVEAIPDLTFEGNSTGLRLEDPAGNVYRSGLNLPVLGSALKVSAPGMKGTWKVSIRGLGSVSGVSVDPTGMTNGPGVPDTYTVTVNARLGNGFAGLDDVPKTHPQRAAIENAVILQLVDSRNGKFEPEAALTRGELAQYVVMGGSVRQSLPMSGKPSFTDVSVNDPLYAFAEAVVAPGGVLRDLKFKQGPTMRLVNGKFEPNAKVSRADLAYTLTVLMGMDAQAKAVDPKADVTALVNGVPTKLADQADIPANLRGYVQTALNQGVIKPVMNGAVPSFLPKADVTRGSYAEAASAYLATYRVFEDGV